MRVKDYKKNGPSVGDPSQGIYFSRLNYANWTSVGDHYFGTPVGQAGPILIDDRLGLMDHESDPIHPSRACFFHIPPDCPTAWGPFCRKTWLTYTGVKS